MSQNRSMPDLKTNKRGSHNKQEVTSRKISNMLNDFSKLDKDYQFFFCWVFALSNKGLKQTEIARKWRPGAPEKSATKMMQNLFKNKYSGLRFSTLINNEFRLSFKQKYSQLLVTFNEKRAKGELPNLVNITPTGAWRRKPKNTTKKALNKTTSNSPAAHSSGSSVEVYSVNTVKKINDSAQKPICPKPKKAEKGDLINVFNVQNAQTFFQSADEPPRKKRKIGEDHSAFVAFNKTRKI